MGFAKITQLTSILLACWLSCHATFPAGCLIITTLILVPHVWFGVWWCSVVFSTVIFDIFLRCQTGTEARRKKNNDDVEMKFL
jgi:hypothetical protein